MPENEFSWYHLIEAGKASHVGSSITMRSNNIDMSVVRESCRYDKSGYKRFVKTMKRHLFGNSATRMTAERCEEFFDDRVTLAREFDSRFVDHDSNMPMRCSQLLFEIGWRNSQCALIALKTPR